ncbi:uncharacterized protein AB675_8060 [Cyphellophora attinorum]|uniref:F-box domain-containing protein n=1 Tax=Cyphellophora attinorum TaxID=1664694 RepID=A0A0N0NN98_9EURO|nr:uncharacterized protein AB675_8060 [Phialophora attinorum]KPI41119.1 hypothetical protein AB675_8060 [Phialophora attinorum]
MEALSLSAVDHAVSELSETSDGGQSDVLRLLIRQPPEIRAKVLEILEVKDLLTLRRVNHALHELIHEHEAGLCASYRRTRPRTMPSISPVHGNARDLIFYIDLKQQDVRMWHLAHVLVDYYYPQSNEEGVADKVRDHVTRDKKRLSFRQVLFRAMFMLDNFLEALCVVMNDADEAFKDWDDDTYLGAVDVFMLDQQHIIEDLAQTPQDVVDMLAAWKLLLAMCDAKKLKFTLHAPHVPFASIKRIVLYCGLSVLSELLEGSQDVAVRRNLLGEMCGRASRYWNARDTTSLLGNPPLDSIHHLAVDRHRMAGYCSRRASRVVNKFVETQDIISQAAFSVLQRESNISDPEAGTQPSTWASAVLSGVFGITLA